MIQAKRAVSKTLKFAFETDPLFLFRVPTQKPHILSNASAALRSAELRTKILPKFIHIKQRKDRFALSIFFEGANLHFLAQTHIAMSISC